MCTAQTCPNIVLRPADEEAVPQRFPPQPAAPAAAPVRADDDAASEASLEDGGAAHGKASRWHDEDIADDMAAVRRPYSEHDHKQHCM